MTKNRTKDSTTARTIGILTLILMAAFTLMTGVQIEVTPTNPGWYALLWVFAGLGIMALGHLKHWLPRSPGANGLMLIIYVLGVFVVPLAAEFVLHWNMAVGLIATPFAVGFVLAAKYYGRMVEAHQQRA